MKALVLFSGGLDSTTCLVKAIEKYTSSEVIALSIIYGQKHSKEIIKASEIASYYNVLHKVVDFKEIFEGSNCSLLEGSTEDIPQSSYKEQIKNNNGNPVSTYVPFRNGLFLSAAASIALSFGCEVIYYGIHSDDACGNAYPDTSSEFNDYINKAIFIGTNKELRVEAPFVNYTKADVVKEGTGLNVRYDMTWSCYYGKDKACGKCGTCIDRRNAFLKNGLIDPIDYEV